MTNFEKYKDEILNVSRENSVIGKENNTLHGCGTFPCRICDFAGGQGTCLSRFLKWCYEECTELAPKLTKGERGLCEYLKTGYIARDSDGNLFCYKVRPTKNLDNWSTLDYTNAKIKYDTFPFITWEDEDPWSIEDLLKLEVEK